MCASAQRMPHLRYFMFFATIHMSYVIMNKYLFSMKQCSGGSVGDRLPFD